MLGPLSLVVVLGAGVTGMGVAFLAWLNRERSGARLLTLFVVAASCWALVHGLELAAGGLETTRFWARLGLVVSAIIPLAWFLTVLAYTGNRPWLTRGRLAALLVEPALFAALVWTEGGPSGHGLVWTSGHVAFVDGVTRFATEYGLAFWAHTGYTYALVLVGGFLLIRMAARSPSLYRSQSTALFAAIALPMIANALTVFGIVPLGFDLTPVAYVLTGVVLAWAMFRSRLLSLSPLTRELGRQEAIESLDDRVIVLDGEDRVVDANPAAESLLGAPLPDLLGEPLTDVLPALEPVLADADGAEDIALEYDGKLRHFDVRISALSRTGRTVSGRLVSLRDVTDRRQREQRLDVLNRLLRHNVRNELNVVRGNAELVRTAVTDPELEERLDRITDTTDGVARRSDKIARLTRTLEADSLGPGDVATVVDDAVRSAQHGRDAGHVAVDVPAGVTVRGSRSLTAAIRELVENALEHAGEDPQVTVRVDADGADDGWVVVAVADDGPGIEAHEYRSILAGEETSLQHGSGVGLWLVNWLVTEIGGRVEFESTSAGTTVRCFVPRAADERIPRPADTEDAMAGDWMESSAAEERADSSTAGEQTVRSADRSPID